MAKIVLVQLVQKQGTYVVATTTVLVPVLHLEKIIPRNVLQVSFNEV